MSSPDYYEILGVSKDATSEQIKKAYRKMAMKVHPDVAQTSDAEEKFKQLNEAYEVLSDPNKKAVYDRGGDPLGRSGAGSDPFGSMGFGNFSGFTSQGFDLGDLFGAMFSQGRSRGPQPRVRHGQDQLIGAHLTLGEAVFGTVKTVEFDSYIVCPTCQGNGSASGQAPVTCTQCQGRGEVITTQHSLFGQVRTSQPCPACQGHGTTIPDPCAECSSHGRVVSRRSLNVKIPAGVDNGNRIHLQGQGEVGPGGGAAGDLYVEISVDHHDVFTRDRNNLEMTMRIPMTLAALGTRIEIATLEAELESTPDEDKYVSVDIPPGTQPGTRIVVKGKGAPSLRPNRRGEKLRGDLGITFLVQTPTKLSDEQRVLLEQLAELRGESGPEPVAAHEAKGFFERLREAFGA